MIGARLRQLRERKNLSQSDVQNKSGLLRCYLSRLENGHTVPGLETLGKLARALEVPLYQFFCTGEKPSEAPNYSWSEPMTWRGSGKPSKYLCELRKCLGQSSERDQKLIMAMAQEMALRSARRKQVADR